MALQDHDSATEPCGCERDSIHAALCDLFDGSIDAARAEEIRREIAECPSCSARLDSEETIRILMRRCAESDSAPMTLRQRITTELRITRY